MSINNEFDAFSGGVSLGGHRNTTQIKVLITYLVSRIGEPMKSSMIVEALQVHELANYFETTQALDDLIENGNLSLSEGLVYITPKGALSVDELSKELMTRLHRGVTEIKVHGMYSDTDRYMLVCIVNKRQIGEMMKIIKKYPDTFASFEKVNEVFGNFKRKV